jgi:hypothetical protein
MQYCFVVGCSRSGTTAITRLLHTHEAVVMGMERYKTLVNGPKRDTFGPELFVPDRFLDFRPDDTNITPDMERFRAHYEIAAERFRSGGVRYVGDKVRAHPRVASVVAERFPDPKVVFIYRDLERVASSFCVRARNPEDTNWPSDVTHERALEQWERAFEVGESLIDQLDGDVFVVRYERLFSGETAVFDAMFRFLDLDVDEELRAYYEKATADWGARETKPLELTTEQREFLAAHADREAEARFDGRLEQQLARLGAA